jgi:tetratricopeptide (TPR) repeat protein
MSLLLDALKKAAEQKVENSRGTEAERESSDETVVLDQTRTEIASENETTRQYDRTSSSQFDVSQTNLENDETDVHTVVADESMPGSFSKDETEVFSEDETLEFYGDRTEEITDDDVTAFMGDETLSDSELEDLTRPTQIDDVSETIHTQSSAPDETVNEDPSLSLFDEDDTLTSEQAAMQAHALSDKDEPDLTPLNDSTKSLNLVEIPEADGTEVEVGISDSGPGSHTLTMDETSTRTFAPDNYDRTLRKPPTSDVTKIFAGAKSDTDIVMTPEYAKTMFRSKSSAQRIHNFKIYLGTALGIFVVIAILGILQIDQDTINIDNSLRHLKRDPMPGLIKNKTDETFTNIFAAEPGSEVDATTLQIVENAELSVDTEEVVAVELGVEEESLAENASVDPVAPEVIDRVEAQQSPTAKVEANSVKNISDNNVRIISVSADESTAGNKIQISSKSRITETDRWLREAYAAYQRGDDEVALAKYNAVLEVDPNNRNALLARAAINVQKNRIADAMRDYRTLLTANPKDSLAMTSLIAIANYSPEQSETQLKLMIRDEPDSPYLNFALGNVFGAQNRWQEAQGLYFTALENNPDDPNYAYNLAVSLEHIARPKVAIAYYQRALNNYSNGLATFDRDMVDARLEMLRQL